MKKFLFPLLFLIIVAGFGIFPEDETKIPEVITNYKMQIIDTDGYSVEVTNVSINGAIYISGKYSKGNMVINFKDIDKIVFKQVSEKKSSAIIHLKNGDKIDLIVDNNLKLKGKSKLGIYNIAIKDIREIVVLGIVSVNK